MRQTPDDLLLTVSTLTVRLSATASGEKNNSQQGVFPAVSTVFKQETLMSSLLSSLLLKAKLGRGAECFTLEYIIS